MIATERQSLDVIDYLIGAGVESDAEAIDRTQTPLMRACGSGNAEIVELMLSHWKCDPNFAFQDGWTALHIAAQAGFVRIVTLLLAKGANVNALTAFGTTPRHAAANENADEVVEILAAAGGKMHMNPIRLG
jgi:ankyrin repeat protein